MFRNQTPALTTQPDMRPSLTVLEPMLIDNMLNLFCAPAVRAQGGEALGPAVEEDGLVEVAEFGGDGCGGVGQVIGDGVDVGGLDGYGEGEVGGWGVVGECGLVGMLAGYRVG